MNVYAKGAGERGEGFKNIQGIKKKMPEHSVRASKVVLFALLSRLLTFQVGWVIVRVATVARYSYKHEGKAEVSAKISVREQVCQKTNTR